MRRIAVVLAALVVVGLGLRPLLSTSAPAGVPGAQPTPPAATVSGSPSPPTTAPPRPVGDPASGVSPVLVAGVCPLGTDHESRLVVRFLLANAAPYPIHVLSVRPVLPLGGLEPGGVSIVSGECERWIPGRPDKVLGVGESRLVTMHFQLPKECPWALPVQARVTVDGTARGRGPTPLRPRSVTLGVWSDLGGTGFHGCPGAEQGATSAAADRSDPADPKDPIDPPLRPRSAVFATGPASRLLRAEAVCDVGTDHGRRLAVRFLVSNKGSRPLRVLSAGPTLLTGGMRSLSTSVVRGDCYRWLPGGPDDVIAPGESRAVTMQLRLPRTCPWALPVRAMLLVRPVGTSGPGRSVTFQLVDVLAGTRFDSCPTTPSVA